MSTSNTRRATRISITLLFLSTLVLAAVIGGRADAQDSKKQNGEAPIPFDLRWEADTRGNFVMIGNSVMTCPVKSRGCKQARNRKGHFVTNNEHPMIYVDVDNNKSTFNSSSAKLALPKGSRVLHASLYWMGNAYPGQGNTGKKAPNVPKSPQEWDSNRAAYKRVLLSLPGKKGYKRLKGDRVYLKTQAQPGPFSNQHFAVVKDVTAEVRKAGNGNYRVANVQTATGDFAYGGWGLIVFYYHPDEKIRNLTLHDGYTQMSPFRNQARIKIGGFRTPPNGQVTGNLGVIAADGDYEECPPATTKKGRKCRRPVEREQAGKQRPAKDGDRMRFPFVDVEKPKNVEKPDFLRNKVNPFNDFFNSTISQNNKWLQDRRPNHKNTFGVDIDRIKIDGRLGNGVEDVAPAFRTVKSTAAGRIDSYRPIAMALAFDLYAPMLEIEKDQYLVSEDAGGNESLQPLNRRGAEVLPGDKIRYQLRVANPAGSAVDATDVKVRDVIPDGTTYVPGSLRIDGVVRTDETGDDTAFFNNANQRAVFHIGDDADADNGGKLNVGSPSVEVSFDVVVDEPATVSEVLNVGVANFSSPATQNETFEAESNEVQAILPVPDVTISKEAVIREDAVGRAFHRGEVERFRINVWNKGAAPTSRPTVVHDELEDYLTLVGFASEGNGWDCEQSTQRIIHCVWDDPIVKGRNNGPPPIVALVRVARDADPQDGTAYNLAEVRNPDDVDPTNNEDEAEVPLAETDLAIRKTAVQVISPAQVKAAAAEAKTEAKENPEAEQQADGDGEPSVAAKADDAKAKLAAKGDAKAKDTQGKKATDAKGVVPGAHVVFKLKVTNTTENVKAFRVRVADALPEGLRLVSVRSKAFECEGDAQANKITCRKAEMAGGEVARIFVTAEVRPEGDLHNVARVSTITPESDYDNNEDDETPERPVPPAPDQPEPRNLPFTGLPLVPSLLVALALLAAGLAPRVRAALRR